MRVFIVEGILFLILFLTLNIYPGYTYFLCSLIFFISIVCVFYMNRFELLTIAVNDNNIHLSFVNNSFFKRKDIKATKDQIEVETAEGQLRISMNGQLQAIVRQKAMTAEEWDAVGIALH